MEIQWFKKLVIGGLISLFVSLTAYVFTGFASVDYVKDYVDVRHGWVKEDLTRIEKKVDYIIDLQINMKNNLKKGDK